MTLLTVSSLTTTNDFNELDVLDQKLVKGGFFDNTTDLNKYTTVSSGSSGSITLNVAAGAQVVENNITQTGNGTVLIN